MKQLFTFLLLAVTAVVFSQAPQSIPYQAVMRYADGTVMSNAAMTITFKIHDVAATGVVVYEETHAVTSNSQGLVSMNVGSGTVVTGGFDNINWGGGNKFLQVLMNAGNGVVDLGTQQMMSVPYALYAEDVNVRVSLTGDSLFIGNQVSIVPGVSAANPISLSNYGAILLPGNTTCQSEYISVTGCGGQDSLLYYDRYYSLTEIGGQCWFAENLATDKYSNGDLIPTGLTNTEWTNTTSGAYAIYDNNLENDAIYGKLYNWYTTVDTRGVCPTGWHVPSDCEWMFLEGVIGLNSQEQQQGMAYRGGVLGGKLKSMSTWSSPNSAATNQTGFMALPGGWRWGFGTSFSRKGTSGLFWCNSEYDQSAAWYRILNYNDGKIGRFNWDFGVKQSAMSIRCIKD
jgi:uncharacterized protein (TIGR02145 family)